LTICVKDNGPGIPGGEQKRIFDRFYKSDLSRGQDKTGSGLGLAIVKEFIQAHGGAVSLVSAPGEGSEFSFTLRLAED
jgi:signal transduction histidine kinase